MGKEYYGKSFQIRSIRVVDADPGSSKCEYSARLASGEFVFCVDAAFEGEDSERITLKVWHHFEKAIRLTASKFAKLDVAQQAKALDDISNEAQYGFAVKVTGDGFKHSGLEPAQTAKGAARDAKGAAQVEDGVSAVRKKPPKRSKK